MLNRMDSFKNIAVSPPPTELENEGWLIKKGKKRYFVLKNNTLMWFDRPQGTAKGSLPVKEYTVQLRDGQNSKKELALIPNNAEKKELKPYVLEGEKSDQDVVDWAKVLKRVLRHEREDDEDPSKLGWLEKKGQKRWFILKEGKLYWFNKEQHWSADAAISANGSLDMSECTVADGPEAKQKGNSTNFNFTVKNSRDTYILTAKSEQEKQEWIDTLKDGMRYSKRSAKEKRKAAALDKNLIPEKKGFLTKKGQKRWFVLKDCVLRWYLDSSEKDERGNLPLLGCTVHMNPDKLEVQLKNRGTHYELYAQSFQEADDWSFMLEIAVERSVTVLAGKELNPRDSVRIDHRGSLPVDSSPHTRGSPRNSMPPESSTKSTVVARSSSNDTMQRTESPQTTSRAERSPAESKNPEEKKPEEKKPEEKKSTNPFGTNNPFDDEEEEPSSNTTEKRKSTAPFKQQETTKTESPTQSTRKEPSPTPSQPAPAASSNASPQTNHLVATNRDLENKLRDMQTQKENLERELKNALGSKETLIQASKAIEKQKNKLEQQVDNLKAQLEKEQEEVESLQDKLAAKERALRRRWRPDYEVDECTFCKSAFGHHCRHCGEIFCAECSAKQAPLSSKRPELVRVCNTCYEAYN